jgi:tetratricopeptide (TPR) repeat protein
MEKGAVAALPAVLGVVLALAGCGSPEARYYPRSGEIGELTRLLDQAKDEQSRFVLIQQIALDLAAAGLREKEIVFLTTHAERFPTDPYNGYYLMLAAEAERELGAVPLAVHYYVRVLANQQDLEVGGASVHLHCLQQLVELESRPAERIGYYKELLSRFRDKVEHPGSLYYLLARSYEEAGEWEQAIMAYGQYRQSADLEVPGYPNASREAAEKVLFYYSDPNWTVPDLGTLVENVRDAIQRKDLAKLRRYQAKVNFFAEGWNQQGPGDEIPEVFSVTGYLASSYPRVEAQLDPASGDQEAWLRTTNWNFRPPTWYLYFRRIDFPAKPEVNGQWEWAGVYFGERL